jgi:hypothetical protein
MTRCVTVQGDGEFEFPVVGESRHQRLLERLCGGRHRSSARHHCTAMLVPEPDNPHDVNAVAVMIEGRDVGYLPRYMASHLNDALQEVGAETAECEAIIVGGWHRDHGDDGYFGVKLDATYPFAFQRDTGQSTPKEASRIIASLVGFRTIDRGISQSRRALFGGLPIFALLALLAVGALFGAYAGRLSSEPLRLSDDPTPTAASIEHALGPEAATPPAADVANAASIEHALSPQAAAPPAADVAIPLPRARPFALAAPAVINPLGGRSAAPRNDQAPPASASRP